MPIIDFVTFFRVAMGALITHFQLVTRRVNIINWAARCRTLPVDARIGQAVAAVKAKTIEINTKKVF